jgi:hypothetical protein
MFLEPLHQSFVNGEGNIVAVGKNELFVMDISDQTLKLSQTFKGSRLLLDGVGQLWVQHENKLECF